jgi:hypothetical protein
MTESTKSHDSLDIIISLFVFALILLVCLPVLPLLLWTTALPAFFFGLLGALVTGFSGAFSLSRRRKLKWCLLSFEIVFIFFCLGPFIGQLLLDPLVLQSVDWLALVLPLPASVIALGLIIRKVRRLPKPPRPSAAIIPRLELRGKDAAWLGLGWLVLLALMFFPIAVVIEVAIDQLKSDMAGFGWIIVFELLLGAGLAGLMGLIAQWFAKSLRRPLLEIKWFLLAFDVTGLAYAIGLVSAFFTPDLISGIFGSLLIPTLFSLAAGIITLALLAKTTSRLRAQNPPPSPGED